MSSKTIIGCLAGASVVGLAWLFSLPTVVPTFLFNTLMYNVLFTPTLKTLAVIHAVDNFRRRQRIGKANFLIFLISVLTALPFLFAFLANSCRGHFCEFHLYGDPDANVVEAFTLVAKSVWYDGFSPTAPITRTYGSIWDTAKDSRFFWDFFIPLYIVMCLWDWAYFVYRDYMITFKDLGRGGSAPTFSGWALARMRAYFANVDVLSPPRVPPMADPYRGRLNVIPKREGPRPITLGVTPQRQVNYRAPPNTQLQLQRLMGDILTNVNDLQNTVTAGEDDQQPQDQLEIRLSFLEPGLMALRRRLEGPTTETGGRLNPRDYFDTRDEFGGEIYHPHRDGTSHCVLHPEDVKVVLDSGFGERHPFATEAWYWKLYFHSWLGIRRPVPTGLVILYAPRHQGEFDIIRQIIEAAIWNETQGRIYSLNEDSFQIPPAPTAGPALG